MKFRIILYILLVSFFAITGRVEMRAGELALASDTFIIEQRLTQPQTWAQICRWIEEDPQMPDREEVRKRTTTTTVLALKNNLLYDLALAPNVEIELSLGRRWSLNAEFKCPWWSNTRKGFCYQLLSGGLEARYRPGSRKHREPLTGHFFGLYAEGGDYDFQTTTTRGYQGDYYAAAGISYGYTRRIARNLALEFSLGVGYLITEYRKYTTYKGDLIWQSSGRYHFLGPTKAKISLVWLLKGGGRGR